MTVIDMKTRQPVVAKPPRATHSLKREALLVELASALEDRRRIFADMLPVAADRAAALPPGSVGQREAQAMVEACKVGLGIEADNRWPA